MSEVVFTFQPSNAQVRVVRAGGVPWFVATDVCRALTLRDEGSPARWTGAIPATEKGHTKLATPGGRQRFLTLSEAGLHALIERCSKPVAATFRDWMVSTVLPALRPVGTVMGVDAAPTAPDLSLLACRGAQAPTELGGVLDSVAALRALVMRNDGMLAALLAEVRALSNRDGMSREDN